MSTPTQRKASKEATTSGMGSVNRRADTFIVYIHIYIYPNPILSQLVQDMRFDKKFILKDHPSFEICIIKSTGERHELS